MNNIEQLVRPDLKNIKPYLKSPQSDAQIWLDKNELPWDVSNSECQDANRYPCGSQELNALLANYYQVNAEQCLLTRGSDDAIDLLVRLFCQPYQDEIIVCPPTFSMYANFAKYQGISVQQVALLRENDFTLDIENILKARTNKTKLIFICSPNNPTGNLISQNDILKLSESVYEKAMVVVDEAYIEFSGSNSSSAYLDKCSNLIVLRTFSKAFGLASVRCGTVLANDKVIKYLNAIVPPYALSQATLNAVLLALKPEYLNKVKCCIDIIQKEREYLAKALSSIPYVIKCWPSCANYLLLQVENANSVSGLCTKYGIAIKKYSVEDGLDNCIRITIGTPFQNQQLLKVLTKLGEV